MESAFVDDIVSIFDPFLRFSPVFCPVIPENFAVETSSESDWHPQQSGLSRALSGLQKFERPFRELARPGRPLGLRSQTPYRSSPSVLACRMLEANHAWTIKPLRDLLGSRILIKLGSKGTGPADDSDRQRLMQLSPCSNSQCQGHQGNDSSKRCH